MHIRPARTTALLTSAALGLALTGAAASQGAPSTLYPLMAGTIGNYSYDLQYGPGTTDDGKPALCWRRMTSHVRMSEPFLSEECAAKKGGKVLRKGQVLDTYGSFTAAGDEVGMHIDVYITQPRVQRLKVKAPGRAWKRIGSANSTVLKIGGERLRFFHLVELNDDPAHAIKARGERKVCKKVKLRNGKTKRRCGWKTIADQKVSLLS